MADCFALQFICRPVFYMLWCFKRHKVPSMTFVFSFPGFKLLIIESYNATVTSLLYADLSNEVSMQQLEQMSRCKVFELCNINIKLNEDTGK